MSRFIYFGNHQQYSFLCFLVKGKKEKNTKSREIYNLGYFHRIVQLLLFMVIKFLIIKKAYFILSFL